MQMAIDVAGFTPVEADQLRQAMGSKRSRERMERLRAAPLRRDGRARHHRRDRRPDLRQAGRVRRTSASPRATRCRSPTSCTRRRGSSCTSPRRSARRCSTRSRWASTRRTPWCRTRAATASIVRTPDVNASRRRRPTLGAVRRSRTAVWRCVSASTRCAASATTWRGHRRRSPVLEHGRPRRDARARRSPMLEALATAGAFGCFDDATGGPIDRRPRCGRRVPSCNRGPDRLAGSGAGADAPTCRA